MISKTGLVRILLFREFLSLDELKWPMTASIVLYACVHDTVLLTLSLFCERRLNASSIGNRGEIKSCVTDGKMRLDSLVTLPSIIPGVSARARR